MLFDATRRNPTVLYVTQRQNGLMVEGHREIMGAQGEKKSNRDSSLKSGIVGTRATENREFDENEDSKQILEHAAEQETALLRKYPLRIDIRDNNPEQVVAERLLEATEYTLATTKSVKNTSVSEMVEDVDVYDAPEPQRLSQSTRAAPVSGFASRQRPLSASNVSTAHRAPPRPHHQITLPTRPSSSNGLPTRGVSGAGILNISSKSAKKFDDDSEVDEDEDEAEILGQPEDENEQNSFLRKKLEEKKIERLEGVNGGGVGSLLDTAIRKMQIQSGEVLSGSINPAATSNSNVITKKLKRKVVVSNGLVKRSQPPGVAPIPGAGKKNLALTIHQKKQEMKGVYVNPVIRPISKPAGNPPAGGKSNLESKGGFVEKKRVGISSANSQKLSLSKSAPVIQRPQSAPSKALKSAATLGVVAGSLGPSGGVVGGGGHASNPYTQRALNPGILF